MGKIDAWVAGLRVLEDWGVERVYGLPAGSLNSLMDAFEKEQDRIDFIQVRHEEIGGLAAAMQYKFSGKLGVALGSAGPGATHLYNGMYDAKYDGVPMLAIVGQRKLSELNLDGFQEFNQNPYFVDVAVYNRRVMFAEQLPKVLDEAIRAAYANRGPAVVEVPVSFGWEEIDEDSFFTSANARPKNVTYKVDEDDLARAVEMLNDAERPIIYAGRGTRFAGEDVVKLSQKIKAPIAVTGINFDTFDYNYEALLGSAARVSWKPANEAFPQADVALILGNNFPFTEAMHLYDNFKHVIQVDIDPYRLGKRQKVDIAFLADAGEVTRQLTEKVDAVERSDWYDANVDNIKNWKEYLDHIETKSDGPLKYFNVYNAINEVADEDAMYSVDVGNVTQTSVRHLRMTPKNSWATSGIFATMGNGAPGAIAAQYDNPDRQVWSLSGDGGFMMVPQAITTQVQYKMPIINVVFTNKQFGFIRDEQEDLNDNFFGVFLEDENFAKMAEAQGAVAYTVTEISKLKETFEKAVADSKAGKTVLIDAKVAAERPIPLEGKHVLKLDPRMTPEEEVNEVKERYDAQGLKPFADFLEAHGLEDKRAQAQLDDSVITDDSENN